MSKITYNGKTYDNNEKLTVLDNLESYDLNIPYQCREGYCGACCMKKQSGCVEYVLEPMAFIDDDEILPCICKSVGDIDIKDIL